MNKEQDMQHSELLTNIACGAILPEQWPSEHTADCRHLVETYKDLQKNYYGRWTVEVALQSLPFDDFKFCTEDGIEASLFNAGVTICLEIYIRDYTVAVYGTSVETCFDEARRWLDEFYAGVATVRERLKLRE